MVRDIKISAELRKFCELIHQDVLELYASPEALIDDALFPLSNSEAVALKNYLNCIISEHSNNELEKMWFESPASIYFSKGQLREFLQLVVSRISQA
jgi:hypothetical protein